jgi:hypothetical protein
MSRSGYSEDCENVQLWRGAVKRAVRGKRGQKFLSDLATAMDAMPQKRLIAHDLRDGNGEFCAMGVALNKLGIDPEPIDIYDYDTIADHVDVAHCLVQEIEFINDGEYGRHSRETPEQRWSRVRDWVARMLLGGDPG